MNERRFRILDWAAVLGAVAVFSPFVLKAQARQDLKIGPELERKLAGGESHSYAIEGARNLFWRLLRGLLRLRGGHQRLLGQRLRRLGCELV